LDVTSTQRASTRGTRRASLGRWPALGPRAAGAGLLAASGSRLAAAAGALFAASTLGGYLLSDWVGLFGFKEVRTTAGIVAGVIEVAAFAALATYTLAASPRRGPARLAAGLAGRLSVARTATTAVGSASVLALVLLVVAVAGSGGPAAGPAGSLRAVTIGGARVLTNSKGFTLYWFAHHLQMRRQLRRLLATRQGAGHRGPRNRRQAGHHQAPRRVAAGDLQRASLYTYVGDTAPGQAHGNNLNLNGGLWHEVIVP
jgi:predicted lipoprotein with Yx(FWY)xxD motif